MIALNRTRLLASLKIGILTSCTVFLVSISLAYIFGDIDIQMRYMYSIIMGIVFGLTIATLQYIDPDDLYH